MWTNFSSYTHCTENSDSWLFFFFLHICQKMLILVLEGKKKVRLKLFLHIPCLCTLSWLLQLGSLKFTAGAKCKVTQQRPKDRLAFLLLQIVPRMFAFVLLFAFG